MFSVRPCVVHKPLRKIFFWAKIFAYKETPVREEKEKKKKIIAQSFSNCILLNILFDCFLSHFKNVLLSLIKGTRTFTTKTWRKSLGSVDKGEFYTNTELKQSYGYIPICLLKERCTVKLLCQQKGNWGSTKLKLVSIHYFHPDPFLFNFSVFASSSPS